MIFLAGGIYASLMPQEEYFSQALYTFDIGQNDFTADLFADMPIEKIYASVPDVINSFAYNVKVASHEKCYATVYYTSLFDDHICKQNVRCGLIC